MVYLKGNCVCRSISSKKLAIKYLLNLVHYEQSKRAVQKCYDLLFWVSIVVSLFSSFTLLLDTRNWHNYMKYIDQILHKPIGQCNW